MAGYGLDPQRSAAALVMGALAAAACVYFWPEEEEGNALPGPWGWLVLGIYWLASLRAFFWIIYPDNDRLKVLSPYNLGDLALHLGLIRYFASGIPFWPPSPILVGEPLTYPPGADFFNSLLLLVGVDWRVGLIVVGVVLATAGGWALWRFGGTFAVAALLFGGGLAGFAVFRSGEFLDFSGEQTWKNAFLTMVVPQRGFLFALPAGLVLLHSWHREIFHGRKNCPLAAQVLLYSTLPLFQVHTFLALSITLAGSFFLTGSRVPLRVVAFSFLPATLFMWLVTGGFSTGGDVKFDPLWAADGEGTLSFFLQFGVALGVALTASAHAWRNGDRAMMWLGGSAATLALIGFTFPLTDWAWDNTKILIWSWLLVAPVIGKWLISVVPVVPRCVVIALLFFTGALSLAAGLDLRHGYELARRSQLDNWSAVLAPLPPHTVFAVKPDYNNPALLLGRRVVCGYEGHLSSHGLDYAQKLDRLRQVLRRTPGWEDIARELGADYVVDDSSLLGSPRLIDPRGDPTR